MILRIKRIRGVHMINWMMGSEYPPDPIVDAIILQCFEECIED